MALQDDKAIADQAAHWWSQRATGGADHRAAFAAWLDADPRHGLAFDAISDAWDAFGELGEEQSGHVESETGLVAVLDDVRKNRRRHNTFVRRGLIGAGLAASLGGLFIWAKMSAPPEKVQAFSTGAGQRIRQTLADGSVLDLDANSSVSVKFGGGRRSVNLLRGRVLFDVTKDADRPFLVRTANGSVTVLGTLFTVEYRDAETSVTLFRGHVKAASAISNATYDLLPGDAIWIGKAGDERLTHRVDVGKALLWREGHLVFENETLDRVVERMNDYSPDRMVISDPEVARMHISGIFQAGQNKAFLNALTSYYGLTAARRNHTIFIGGIKSPS